jgi:hypothetical protein
MRFNGSEVVFCDGDYFDCDSAGSISNFCRGRTVPRLVYSPGIRQLRTLASKEVSIHLLLSVADNSLKSRIVAREVLTFFTRQQIVCKAESMLVFISRMESRNGSLCYERADVAVVSRFPGSKNYKKGNQFSGIPTCGIANPEPLLFRFSYNQHREKQ